MPKFTEELKQDWEKLKEKVREDIKEDNDSVDQMLDYSCTGNPSEVLAESLYAQPQADRAITQAMDEYRASVKDKEQ